MHIFSEAFIIITKYKLKKDTIKYALHIINQHTTGRTRVKNLIKPLLLALFLCSTAFAADTPASKPAPVAIKTPVNKPAPKPDMRGLDKQVQDLKKDVLALNRDLFILEEELLFPATSQIAVFLSVDVGEFFKLDAVKLTIDNKPVSHYLYTEREIDALHRGGVQRLHIGNLKVGPHELVATFIGRGPKGREYKRATTLLFKKELDAKYLELQIVDSASKHQPEFKVKEWN